MMLLSILIPTMPTRKQLFQRLRDELYRQIGTKRHEVEILWDDSEESVGFKRQALLERARGQYVAFIDDDDEIDKEYISIMMKILPLQPDVVGFKGYITTNGARKKLFSISKDHPYEERNGVYYRFNNHLCPVKRSIALQIGYKDMTFGEDFQYAEALKASGLIQTEVFIDKELYHYKYVTKK